ncbi:hypothetical protein ACFLX1_02015 [Chloroflexota bacterium]
MVGIEVVAPTASFGLGMVYAIGRRREKKQYKLIYDSELADLEKDSIPVVKIAIKESIKETIDEQVQRVLRERLK